MKAILISIQPRYLKDILNGNKTLEIRKSIPKCDLPIDVFIYCTKNTFLFQRNDGKWVSKGDHFYESCGTIHYEGKVVAKFTLNKVEEIKRKGCYIYTDTMFESALLDKSCLDLDTICHYLKHEEWQEKEIVVGYAWHIDNLVVFDKPKELGEFSVWGIDYPTGIVDPLHDCSIYYKKKLKPLIRAPQSWYYIEV